MAVRTMMSCFLAFITLLVSGYVAANEDCMFTNSMFTPKRNKIGEITEEECKNACGQELYCIYWQILEKDCWLHLADAKNKKNSDFGINNCKDGKPAVPTECKNYKVLNASTRNIKKGNENGLNCDWLDNPNGISTVDWQGPNWYRFEGGAGNQLATKPPGINHCGTHASGWTNSELPSKVGSSNDIKVCFELTSDCTWSIAANATNCGSYMVYHFDNTPVCYLRYCGTN